MRELKTFSGRKPSQHPDELGRFIDLLRLKDCRSYLEIGARHGDTFYEVMMALPKGSLGVAVDLPGAAWGIDSSRSHLVRACEALRSSGYKAQEVFGDSKAAATRMMVARRAPAFDAVLIDGDHRYDGVKADWEFCRGLTALAAFHDIAGEGQVQPSSGLPVEVPRLWRELKAGAHRLVPLPTQTYEFVAPGSAMGIGVICLA